MYFIVSFAVKKEDDICRITPFPRTRKVKGIVAQDCESFRRLLFDIQIGFLDADVITELATYETDSWVKNILHILFMFFTHFIHVLHILFMFYTFY